MKSDKGPSKQVQIPLGTLFDVRLFDLGIRRPRVNTVTRWNGTENLCEHMVPVCSLAGFVRTVDLSVTWFLRTRTRLCPRTADVFVFILMTVIISFDVYYI